MNNLNKLFRKKTKYVVGLMSGTSADGIDAVLVEIKNNGEKTKIKELAFQTYPFSNKLKQYIIKNSNPTTSRLDDITHLNILMGEYFADAALNIIKKAGLKKSDFDLIGSHGQTIAHLPDRVKMFGKNISATLQIGDPMVIAKRTGLVTVGDFRIADVAVGGSGAPLVPYFDYIIFRSSNLNRGILNIGGIANITVIPKNSKPHNVFAFDTGPGNMIIDNLMNLLFNKPYDEFGTTAYNGKINPTLLNWMSQHNYLKIPPPKSTGREIFGLEFIEKILKKAHKIPKLDIITTVTEFTALTIYQSYLNFIKKRDKLDEIIVSGGGAHNLYILNSLIRYFKPIKIKLIENYRYSSDSKEAVCFAFLANETISGNPANLPYATGAQRATILGKICLP